MLALANAIVNSMALGFSLALFGTKVSDSE